MKSWIFALCGLWMVAMSLQAGASKPPIVLRFHTQVSDQEKVDTTGVVRVEIPDPAEAIQIHKYAILSEKNVAQATPLPDGGTMIQLDATGVTVLDTETSTNLGKILVVICNGRVVYAPIIDQPMRQGRIIVPGLLPAEVQALRDYIVKRNKG